MGGEMGIGIARTVQKLSALAVSRTNDPAISATAVAITQNSAVLQTK
jgi:hypothetical protein